MVKSAILVRSIEDFERNKANNEYKNFKNLLLKESA